MKQDLYDRIAGYIIGNQDKFYRLDFSYAHNRDDALDIVQNAVCRALDHYESLRDENAVRTWFYRILVNESLAFLKCQRREVLTDEDLEAAVPYYEKAYEPDGGIYEQISWLEADVQTIIKLRFFEELSLKEISEVTDTNINTVKAKLYRGLRLLKQNIQEVDV